MQDKWRIDGTKIHFHPRWTANWLKKKDDWESAKTIYPIYVELSPVGSCQHRCTFCTVSYLGYKPIRLDVDRTCDLLREMASLGVKSVMFAGEGEPLLHKRINNMVSAAADAGIDVAFTTNGVLLDKLDLSMVTWVKVSLNAGSRETYAKVHRTKPEDFDRVVENLRTVPRGKCSVGAQMVLLPENEHEIDLVNKLGEELNLDYFVIKKYVKNRLDVKPEYENYSVIAPPPTGKLIVRQKSFDTDRPTYDKCQATPYAWAYVMASGDLYSCSAYLGDEKFNLGNINKNTFKEIWHSEKRRQNWLHVRDTLDIGMCKENCRMDRTNRYMTELIHGVPSQNFI